ncbi:CocE/NonD family hydrolase [Vibrio sp. SCSIO 43136]|uniref:alpha/beta hydrolase n=1 Tax=Vibrio sp. SCSIO 43136 TaxID=2819101 RepID=UPI002075BEC4|nr:CocE/NonD family hydrolase [Vibrio sp. SCSIO 43136]USD67199.1 alpha/beta hydrolase [Vibrio sp. SCSIO 43136]
MNKKALVTAVATAILAANVHADTIVKHTTLKTSVGDLAANVYLPDNVENPPVVVVTGAWTTVKEQMPATYAEHLADQGYAAVTFDFRGWGESQDRLTQLEDPQRKIEDIKAVFASLDQVPGIDASHAYGLGVCASSGYMLDAVLGNDNVVAAAAVAPWLHDRSIVNAVYGGAESVGNLIQTGIAALSSDEPQIIEGASLTNQGALMYNVPYYTEEDRGLIPEWDNAFNLGSWAGWLTYDAHATAAKQDKPVLLVASESMAIPAGTHGYLEKAGDNVEAVWLENVSQFDFYDVEKDVQAATDAVVAHFARNL